MPMTKYDKTSVISIVEYANRLTGKTLADVVPDSVGLENKRNLGNLGTIVEKFYFEHDPPNDHNPDFSEAGLELKTTGIWQKSGQHRAKERLVLSMINFQTIIEEDWDRCCALLQIRRQTNQRSSLNI
jgi:DNA mismatch repair protein MutH